MAVKIKGYEQLAKKLDRTLDNAKSGLYSSVSKSWMIVERTALDLVTGPLRAVDTGLMRSTLTHYKTRKTKDLIAGEVGYCVDYAYVVHEGMGMHQGNRRPTLTVALFMKKKLVVETIQNAVKAEIMKV